MGQISLDTYQIGRLLELLEAGSEIVKRTGRPIMLYRQTIDEGGDSYEEIVCSLVHGYVIEQVVVSGGMVVPAFSQQDVFTFEEYSGMLRQKSADKFVEVVALLEDIAKIS